MNPSGRGSGTQCDRHGRLDSGGAEAVGSMSLQWRIVLRLDDGATEALNFVWDS